MTNKEKVELAEIMMHEIIIGSRKTKINTIMEYSGEEYEDKESIIELAKADDMQLNIRLKNIATYYLNEIQ